MSSVGSSGFIAVVNGPIRTRLGIESSFAPSGRANAVIGRAATLCFMNVGQIRTGMLDKGNLGSPYKFTQGVIAENEEDSV